MGAETEKQTGYVALIVTARLLTVASSTYSFVFFVAFPEFTTENPKSQKDDRDFKSSHNKVHSPVDFKGKLRTYQA